MPTPDTLFTTEPHVDLRTIRARTLVVTLTGFLDAGHVQRLIDEHLLDTLPHHQLGRFDMDQLIDYRGQRPVMTFDVDKYTEYEQPTMALHHVVDETSVPFLLLAGSEPDLRWEALVKAIEHVIDQTMIDTIVFVGSVPMPTPHTRPVLITRHASDPSLIPGNEPVFGRLMLGASFPALLEFRLQEAGKKVIGLTAHIPHYLAQTDYPDAAVALVKAFAQATGHGVPTTELAVRAGIARAQIGAEIQSSEEAQQLVQTLEEQYDEFQQRREGGRLAAAPEDLPTGDDIAAEAEAFLRAHAAGGEGDEDGRADEDDDQAGPGWPAP